MMQTNADFRCAIYDSVQRALQAKLIDAGIPANGKLEILAQYLVEDLAIVLYLSHLASPCYPVMVVPHFIPPVLPKLYEGPYAALFADVTKGESFRSLTLASCEDCAK